MPDKDGYPTPEEETRIQSWPPFSDYPGLLAFVQSCWWQAEWGRHEVPYVDPGTGPGAESDETGIEYHLSTGGWSGNETLIAILREKPVGFWSQCWIQSRWGGHYIFRVQTPVTR